MIIKRVAIMFKLNQKSFIFTVLTVATLSACGSKPVKDEAAKPVVVAPIVEEVAPPVKPVAEVVALGERQEALLFESIPPRTDESKSVQLERIEFKPQAEQPPLTEGITPQGAPEGMGKPAANTDALKAMVSAQIADTKPVTLAPSNKLSVEKKLRFARMMLMTKSGRRVSESDNQEAKLILKDVSKKLDRVERQINEGDSVAADATLGEAMRLFNLAGRMVPSEDLKEKQKRDFPGLKEELDIAKDLHHRNYKRVTAQHGMGAGVNYDVRRVADLEVQAEQHASAGDYPQANESLTLARDMIQAAIRQMMTGRKIVYELNIDTPEAEFKYELNKYIGYEELIPIAIEQKKPSKGIQMLAMRHVKEAKRMADSARTTASASDYPRAIRMLQDATAEIRKALKLMGVPNIG